MPRGTWKLIESTIFPFKLLQQLNKEGISSFSQQNMAFIGKGIATEEYIRPWPVPALVHDALKPRDVTE